ncbi:unnamed protein product [Sphagnum troendelagicum]|uniref:Uncharacterized protein n=1 Tax=Sphagnum troendelagicum TaxID=128251 RepID=A0ABP0UYI2_9BRYO
MLTEKVPRKSRFRHAMRVTQGAFITGSVLNIILGFNGLWGIASRCCWTVELCNHMLSQWIAWYSCTAVVNRTALLAVEVEWLQSIKANLVVSDIVPIACKAAAQVGIPSVCVSNFSWDFIYSEYVTVAGNDRRSIVWQIAEDYSHALFVIRLPGYCPMPAFRDVIDVPMIVRKVHRSRQQVRKDSGISENVKVLLFNFGGQDARWSLKEEYIPQGWLCLVLYFLSYWYIE